MSHRLRNTFLAFAICGCHLLTNADAIPAVYTSAAVAIPDVYGLSETGWQVHSPVFVDDEGDFLPGTSAYSAGLRLPEPSHKFFQLDHGETRGFVYIMEGGWYEEGNGEITFWVEPSGDYPDALDKANIRILRFWTYSRPVWGQPGILVREGMVDSGATTNDGRSMILTMRADGTNEPLWYAKVAVLITPKTEAGFTEPFKFVFGSAVEGERLSDAGDGGYIHFTSRAGIPGTFPIRPPPRWTRTTIDLPEISEDETNPPGCETAPAFAASIYSPFGVASGAVVGAPTGWQYWSPGNQWLPFPGSIGPNNAFLLPPDSRIRFVPPLDSNGWSPSLEMLAWMHQEGLEWTLADPASATNTIGFSGNVVGFRVPIRAVADAPKLRFLQRWLYPIYEDDRVNGQRSLGETLFGAYHDPDGDPFAAVAIIGGGRVDGGKWQYTDITDYQWRDVPPDIDDSGAIVLSPHTAVIRFLPDQDFHGDAPPLLVRLGQDPTRVQTGDARTDIRNSIGGSGAYSGDVVAISMQVIGILDDDAPRAVNLSANVISEEFGAVIGRLSADDPDLGLGDVLTFELYDPDTGIFEIVEGDILKVKDGCRFDASIANPYTLVVAVRDLSNRYSAKYFDLVVTDANEPPSVTGPALRFVTASDRIELPHVAAGQEFTFEAMVYLESDFAGGRILSLSDGDERSPLRFRIDLDSGGYAYFGKHLFDWAGTTKALPRERWVHFAAVHSGGTVSMFFNGNLVRHFPYLPILEDFTAVTNYIGPNPVTGGAQFNGGLRNIRFWNCARTQTQLFESMAADFIEPGGNLVFQISREGDLPAGTSVHGDIRWFGARDFHTPGSRSIPLAGLEFSDTDGEPGDVYTVRLESPAGCFADPGGSPGVAIEGSGTGSLVLKGTFAALRSHLALGSVSYTPPPLFHDGVLELRMAVREGTDPGRPFDHETSFQVLVPWTNFAPTSIKLSNLAVHENDTSRVVGRLHAVDPNQEQEVSMVYALESDPDAVFEIAGDELRLREGASLDFEVSPSHPVVIRSTDPLGLGVSVDFVIAVLDQNDPPVVRAPIGPIHARHGDRAESYELSAVFEDQDRDQVLTYSVHFVPDDRAGDITLSDDGMLGCGFGSPGGFSFVIRAVDPLGAVVEQQVLVDVGKARLRLAVDDANREEGEDNPSFTVSAEGFVPGDTLSDLDGVLAFHTEAGPGSPAGTYAVTPSGVGSSLYEIDFVAGTLSVAKASSYANWGRFHYGEGVSAISHNANGVPNLLLYAMGMDPDIPGGAVYLPYELSRDDGMEQMVVSVPILRSDVLYMIESSPNLDNWSPIAVISKGAADPYTHRLVDNFEEPSAFYRVRVELLEGAVTAAGGND